MTVMRTGVCKAGPSLPQQVHAVGSGKQRSKSRHGMSVAVTVSRTSHTHSLVLWAEKGVVQTWGFPGKSKEGEEGHVRISVLDPGAKLGTERGDWGGGGAGPVIEDLMWRVSVRGSKPEGQATWARSGTARVRALQAAL